MREGKFEAYAAHHAARDVNDRAAVILACGRMVGGMSIPEARQLANDLARAADDAEAKLPS
jgi:hypothetical protein